MQKIKSLRGEYLIAAKHMGDPTFFRAAVLMLEHGDEGSMGLVVNRPSSVSVANALSKHFPVPESERMIYFGGPVEPAALCILHNDEICGQEDHTLAPGIYIGSHDHVFENMVCENEADEEQHSDYRVFCGYSGWGPGQLDSELERGDWHIVPGKANYLFDSEPYEIWDLLFKEVYKRNRFIDCPEDQIRWN